MAPSSPMICAIFRRRTSAARMVGPLVEPGQFLHLLVPRLNDAVLRRPFSIYQADEKGHNLF